mgnify:CR=1 FL=1|tara:strand:- start:65 stop:709 length:645 start_codon:yes stop_codon:yes gene_type:complete
MKKNWYLHLDSVIWVEFWDEIPFSTISLKFVINKKNELINSEIRLLPLQPKPETNNKLERKPGIDITNNSNTQLMTINTRKINLLRLRQRSLNIIFDYQELNSDIFNKKTLNKFNYPITYKEASKILNNIKHKKNTKEHMALISLLYVGQIHRGNNRPYNELNISTTYSVYYLKNMIKKARKSGYLTKPVNKGISGGTLTNKTIKLLHSYSSTI